MKNTHAKKVSKKLIVLCCLFVLVLSGLLLQFLYLSKASKNSITVKAPKPEVSTFEKFNDTTMKDPILSYDFKNIALMLLGVTGMPEFEDSPAGWKIILKPDQYIADISCANSDFTDCTLNFISAQRDDFKAKEFNKVNLTEICPATNTSYINGDIVYFPDDSYDVKNYSEKPFKVIFYYPKNDLSSDKLVTPDWCIYYAK